MVSSILLLLVLSELTHAVCTGPSCPAAVAGCSSNPGCYVNYAKTPRCSQPWGCDFKNQSSCATTSTCEWKPGSGGYCGTDSCSASTESACTSAGCQWNPPSGYCYPKSCSYGEGECESNGCKWKSKFCGVPDFYSCRVLSRVKCVKETTGCVWNDNFNECNVANDLNCKDNSAKTGCDVSSDAGCWWQSGYCYTSSDSACYSVDDKAACDSEPSKTCEWRSSDGYCSSLCVSTSTGCADGIPNYCHWVADAGECRDKNYYCQTKLDGSDCTDISDKECIFQPATAESCGADELVFMCSLDGDSCSADSLEEGCVDSSDAFIVRVSLRLAFFAVLSFLFL